MTTRRETWSTWIRQCCRDEGNPIRVPGSLGMLTGQDHRALNAIDAAWALYAVSDENGQRGALDAVRALLPALQHKCWPFARELIARHMEWDDRGRLWPTVVAPLARHHWTAVHATLTEGGPDEKES